MNNRILAVCMTAASVLPAMAQTSYDAFQLMGDDLNGTARYVGMGGAMNAFGSDISVMSKNPAGTGTFSTSDVNTSLSFSWADTHLTNEGLADGVYVSSYADRSHSNLRVGLDNASFVLVMPTYDSGSSLRSMNMGFSYHRARDTRRSMDYFDYFNDHDGYTVFREFSDKQRNLMSALDFNLSFNHNDRFYWGVTLETMTTTYQSEGFFYDYYPVQEGYRKAVDETSLDRSIEIDGRGWSFKGGIIARPAGGNFRFGLSMSTPTFYRVNQYYTDYMYALNGEEKDGGRYDNDVAYNLISPWTFNASLGYSEGNNAIGVEYEYNAVDGTAMSIGNQEILTQCGDLHYKSYSVFRVGYETNISKLSLRCGYNYTFPRFNEGAAKYRGWYNEASEEFIGDTQFNEDRYDWDFENISDAHTFTVGAGYCSAPDEDGTQFYVDGAFVYSRQNSDFNLGEYANDPMGKFRTERGRVLVTFGILF